MTAATMNTADGNAVSAEQFPLSKQVERFDSKRMGQHSFALGCAADSLNAAYSTGMAISAIAGIVRRSQINKDNDGPRLTDYEEDCLLSAVGLLADGLTRKLESAADGMDNILGPEGGGK